MSCGAADSLTVSGHYDSNYNGEYCRGDDWNNLPHFVNDNGMHFYYFDTNNDWGYWEMDYRE